MSDSPESTVVRHAHDDDPAPATGYRSYEVYQRERVADSSVAISARRLIGDEMLTSPFELLAIVREHEPCYRDWVGNRFWITGKPWQISQAGRLPFNVFTTASAESSRTLMQMERYC
jgi:hypothetical protein